MRTLIVLGALLVTASLMAVISCDSATDVVNGDKVDDLGFSEAGPEKAGNPCDHLCKRPGTAQFPSPVDRPDTCLFGAELCEDLRKDYGDYTDMCCPPSNNCDDEQWMLCEAPVGECDEGDVCPGSSTIWALESVQYADQCWRQWPDCPPLEEDCPPGCGPSLNCVYEEILLDGDPPNGPLEAVQKCTAGAPAACQVECDAGETVHTKTCSCKAKCSSPGDEEVTFVCQ